MERKKVRQRNEMALWEKREAEDDAKAQRILRVPRKVACKTNQVKVGWERKATLWPWLCALALRPSSKQRHPSTPVGCPRGTLEHDPPSPPNPSCSALTLLGRCKPASSINITLSSSVARLVWAATERYHIKLPSTLAANGALFLQSREPREPRNFFFPTEPSTDFICSMAEQRPSESGGPERNNVIAA